MAACQDQGLAPFKERLIMNSFQRIAITNMTLPFRWSEAFWGMWIKVMFPSK